MGNSRNTLRSTKNILSKIKLNWALLLSVMFLSSVLELLGITVIPVFLNFVQNKDAIADNRLLEFIFDASSMKSRESRLIALSVLLFIVYFLKSLIYWLSQILITHEQQEIQKKIRLKVFNAFLRAPYENYIQSDLSEFLQRVYRDVETFMSGIVMNGLILIMEVLKFAGIAVGLILLDPIVVLALAAMGGVIGYILKNTKSRVYSYGKIGSESSKNIFKVLNQAFSTFVIMRINNSEGFFEKKLIDNIDKSNSASLKYTALNLFPRMVIEILIFAFVVGIVIMNVKFDADDARGIAILGTFAAASISLVPSLTKISSSVTGIKNSEYAAQAVADLISEAAGVIPPKGPMSGTQDPFFESLKFEGLEYSYPGAGKKILNGLNLEIRNNECLGIIGKSGAGKTTLVNVILGILKPQAGRIVLNGKEINDLSDIRSIVSYVPQNIVLLDDAVRSNVAYGIEDSSIDDDLVLLCLESAGLKEHVSSMPNGISTVVGENGIKLSGGQRQRLGIARALYKKPKILIFDEGTSALDSETENRILETLYKLSAEITLIMVAHRLSTLDRATRIIQMDRGHIVYSGPLEGRLR